MVGLVRIREDFGGSDTAPPAWQAEVAQAASEVRTCVDRLTEARYGQRELAQARIPAEYHPLLDPPFVWMGAGEDAARAALARLEALSGTQPPPTPGKPPPLPEPPPTSTALRGFAVTYSGHDPARDVYLGLTGEAVQWGPHHGIDLVAPVAGRIEAYSFGTPLAVLQSTGADAYLARHGALFADMTCIAPHSSTAHPLQTMHIAVFWPDTPLQVHGTQLRAIWFGHVHPSIRTGRVAKGDVFGQSWDSGIRFEPQVQARAAHVHACASTSGQLSPNGDTDGMLACEAMGWQVSYLGQGPGPQHYLSGAYAAGRLRSDFIRAERPLPPLPE